jgi:hypothetical protein
VRHVRHVLRLLVKHHTMEEQSQALDALFDRAAAAHCGWKAPGPWTPRGLNFKNLWTEAKSC